jgi:hypothetical protein
MAAEKKTALEKIAEAYGDIDDGQEEQERIVKEEQKQEKAVYYTSGSHDQKVRQTGMNNYVYAMLSDLQSADARSLKHMIQSMTSYDYMAFLAYVRPAVKGCYPSAPEGTAPEHPFADFMRNLPNGRGSFDGRKVLSTKATPEIVRSLIAPALSQIKTDGGASNTTRKPLSWMREDLKCPSCPKFFQRPCRLRLHQQRKHKMIQ